MRTSHRSGSFETIRGGQGRPVPGSRSPRGLSLLEVQIALLILMVGILTVVAMAPVGSRNIDLAQKSTLSMNYARHLMEVTRALPYDHQVSTSRRTLMGVLPGVPAGSPVPGFEYEVSVSVLPENTEIHLIEVRVFWTDPDASGHTIQRSCRLVGYSARIT